MRKALVIGVDYYAQLSKLFGCVNDANEVKAVLEKHGDGSVNFGVFLLTATDDSSGISRAQLKESVRELFADDSEIALFYFAGHGYIETTGGYLCGSDSQTGDDGLSLAEVLVLANESPARNKVIVLDSCHSGIAGTPPGQRTAELTEGIKRPRFSWTRIKGESNVQGGGENGSVEGRGTGRGIGTDGGSPEGDWSPCRRRGGRGGLPGAGAAVERQPEARRGAAAAAWRIAGGAVP